MVEGCKLSHTCSIWIDGKKITIIGTDSFGVPIYEHFEAIEFLRSPIFIDENLVHCQTDQGGVMELSGQGPANFTIRMLTN